MPSIKLLTDLKSVSSYLQRIDAEPRSLRSAVIRELRGAYWKDIAIISISKEGVVKAPEAFMPTEGEMVKIKDECSTASWPELNKIQNLINLPPMLKNADSEDTYVFRDAQGLITMVQQRIDNSEGGKAYVPWTYWDDNEWRRMEPEGKLPIFGLEQLKEHSVVFVHEGAKAARRMQKMVAAETVQEKEKLKKHPWGKELSNAAHVGWIGGALSPARTDWSQINKLGAKEVFIVSDNDEPGVAAVPAISYQLRVPTFHIQFTNEWPASFDLADEFPKSMFREMNGYRHYIGPSFRTCTHPATWATDKIPNPSGKGKPIHVLRDSFKNQWAFVEESNLYVNTRMPDILRSKEVLNKLLSAFSHVPNTSQMIENSYTGRHTSLSYRPDLKERKISENGSSSINLYIPPQIMSQEGDSGPFLEFLDYLIPETKERNQVERWCATIIARPHIRMRYGLLLISETQGIGKTTLAQAVLTPLLGRWNVSNPSSSDVLSDFNPWIAQKRLAIIDEIYEGRSWRAYNQLKSVITEDTVTVNQKYQLQYRLQNWLHIFASSNSLGALKIESTDRRWLVPRVTEDKWRKAQFDEFRVWLEAGGLSHILHWAENYQNYISTGEEAPATLRKKEMIAESRSEAIKEISDLAAALASAEEPICFAFKHIKQIIREAIGGKIFDSDRLLRQAMKAEGMIVWKKRISVNGTKDYILLNNAASIVLGATDQLDCSDAIRKLCTQTAQQHSFL